MCCCRFVELNSVISFRAWKFAVFFFVNVDLFGWSLSVFRQVLEPMVLDQSCGLGLATSGDFFVCSL